MDSEKVRLDRNKYMREYMKDYQYARAEGKVAYRRGRYNKTKTNTPQSPEIESKSRLP